MAEINVTGRVCMPERLGGIGWGVAASGPGEESVTGTCVVHGASPSGGVYLEVNSLGFPPMCLCIDLRPEQVEEISKIYATHVGSQDSSDDDTAPE